MEVTDSRNGRTMENLESPERHQELCGEGGTVKDSGTNRKKETRRYICVVSAVLTFHLWLAFMITECLLLYLQNIYRNIPFAFTAITSQSHHHLPRLL